MRAKISLISGGIGSPTSLIKFGTKSLRRGGRSQAKKKKTQTRILSGDEAEAGPLQGVISIVSDTCFSSSKACTALAFGSFVSGAV